MRKLRTAIAAAILAALTLTATQSTVANGPPQPVEPPRPFELPAGIACPDFDLRVSCSGGQRPHEGIPSTANGNLVRTITAGKGFLLTYTNLDAGTSVTIRTDGSVSKTTYNPDGTQTVSATGHNGLIIVPHRHSRRPDHHPLHRPYRLQRRSQTGVFTLRQHFRQPARHLRRARKLTTT